MKLSTAEAIFFIPKMIIGLTCDIGRMIKKLTPVLFHLTVSVGLVFMSYKLALHTDTLKPDQFGLTSWFGLATLLTGVGGLIAFIISIVDYAENKHRYW